MRDLQLFVVTFDEFGRDERHAVLVEARRRNALVAVVREHQHVLRDVLVDVIPALALPRIIIDLELRLYVNTIEKLSGDVRQSVVVHREIIDGDVTG